MSWTSPSTSKAVPDFGSQKCRASQHRPLVWNLCVCICVNIFLFSYERRAEVLSSVPKTLQWQELQYCPLAICAYKHLDLLQPQVHWAESNSLSFSNQCCGTQMSSGAYSLFQMCCYISVCIRCKVRGWYQILKSWKGKRLRGWQERPQQEEMTLFVLLVPSRKSHNQQWI